MDIQEAIEQDEKLKRLTEINNANKLVAAMQYEVDKYTKLLQLAKANQVNTIINNINYFNFIFRIKSAICYFHAPKDINKRSEDYKANKLMFESLEKYLEEEVFKKPIKIVNMYSGGYENYFYQIDFIIPDSDTKYIFTVPNPEVINVNNFEHACEGKLAFGYYEGESYQHIEKTSYLVEDITKAFEEFLNDEVKE